MWIISRKMNCSHVCLDSCCSDVTSGIGSDGRTTDLQYTSRQAGCHSTSTAWASLKIVGVDLTGPCFAHGQLNIVSAQCTAHHPACVSWQETDRPRTTSINRHCYRCRFYVVVHWKAWSTCVSVVACCIEPYYIRPLLALEFSHGQIKPLHQAVAATACMIIISWP